MTTQPEPEMPDMKQISRMIHDMELIRDFLKGKGRFVGDMVHISIADLAKRIAAYEESRK